MERALIAVQQTSLRERLQRDVVTSSRKAFDISETRLREGTIDLVTLLQTQQTLFQAQDTLAQAQFDRLTAVVSLFQALGGGLAEAADHRYRNALRMSPLSPEPALRLRTAAHEMSVMSCATLPGRRYLLGRSDSRRLEMAIRRRPDR